MSRRLPRGVASPLEDRDCLYGYFTYNEHSSESIPRDEGWLFFFQGDSDRGAGDRAGSGKPPGLWGPGRK